jgi:hypothetical protein
MDFYDLDREALGFAIGGCGGGNAQERSGYEAANDHETPGGGGNGCWPEDIGDRAGGGCGGGEAHASDDDAHCGGNNDDDGHCGGGNDDDDGHCGGGDNHAGDDDAHCGGGNHGDTDDAATAGPGGNHGGTSDALGSPTNVILTREGGNDGGADVVSDPHDAVLMLDAGYDDLDPGGDTHEDGVAGGDVFGSNHGESDLPNGAHDGAAGAADGHAYDLWELQSRDGAATPDHGGAAGYDSASSHDSAIDWGNAGSSGPTDHVR